MSRATVKQSTLLKLSQSSELHAFHYRFMVFCCDFTGAYSAAFYTVFRFFLCIFVWVRSLLQNIPSVVGILPWFLVMVTFI